MAWTANKYNRSAQQYTVNSEGFEYRSMKDLYEDFTADQVYELKGIYINTKSKYGDSPVFISDGIFINGPQHMLDTAREMMADPEATEAINAGKVGMRIYQYDGNGRKCYSINFVDLK